MSLVEVLDVFPILLRRGRIQSGIPWMVLSIGIGKMLVHICTFKSLKKRRKYGKVKNRKRISGLRKGNYTNAQHTKKYI